MSLNFEREFKKKSAGAERIQNSFGRRPRAAEASAEAQASAKAAEFRSHSTT